MNNRLIKKGFQAAGLMNIGGVLLFSRAFTNEAINTADPVVMSNFGLVMIVIWGLAYISVANQYKKVCWLSAVFCIEKLIYVVAWLLWMNGNYTSISTLYSKDLFAGIFYSIYGINDFIFMLFFGWVFLKTKTISKDS